VSGAGLGSRAPPPVAGGAMSRSAGDGSRLGVPLRWAGCGRAAALTGAALLLSYVLNPLSPAAPCPLFLAAVVLSAWRGGLGPGLLASALSTLAIDYFFEVPRWALAIDDLATALDLAAFAFTATLVSILVGRDARARSLLRGAESAVAEAPARRFAALVEASSILAHPRDYETTLRNVGCLAVLHLADWCLLHILEEDGAVRQLAVVGADPAREALAGRLARRYPPGGGHPPGVSAERSAALPEREVWSLAAGDGDASIFAKLGVRSALRVPLRAHGATLGAVTLVSGPSGRRYGEADAVLAEAFAARAASAIAAASASP
jgi:hypothetical protein